MFLIFQLACFNASISKNAEQFPDNPNHDYDGDGLTEVLGDCDDLNPEVMAGPWYADEDNDGFGNPFVSTTDCNERIGYVDNDLDCNDEAQTVYPGSNREAGLICVLDLDGDGYGEQNPPPPYQPGTDCNDSEPLSTPVAIEICDEIDNDCDGNIDENDAAGAPIWYLDNDEDGFGNEDVYQASCVQPFAYVSQAGDCDDNVAAANPLSIEYCNGFDDNCDGQTDESTSVDVRLLFQDFDGDGFGNAGVIVPSCDPISGYVDNGDDCNDLDSSINPDADEYCDGFDNNCDLQIDDGSSIDSVSYYIDSDGDGFGLAGTAMSLCYSIPGRVDNNLDCNDGNPAINPNSSEYCNNIDDDCNMLVDDEAIDKTLYYVDQDQDGYGNTALTFSSCPDFDPITGVPGSPAGYSNLDGDCDDSTAERSPGNTELCTANIDENCDEDPTLGATDLNTYYADGDGDGYGSALYELRNCTQPPGYVLYSPGDAVDCNDNDSEVLPEKPSTWELCNGKLDRCEDDDGNLTPPSDELDDDGDGYVECTLDVDPLQWNNSQVIIAGGDCEDTDPLAYPGAVEICNGAFEDCDDPYLTVQPSPNLETDNDGDGYVECAGFDPITWEGAPSVIGDQDCNDIGTNAAFAFPGAGNDPNTCVQDADGDGLTDCVYEYANYGCDLGVFFSETTGIDFVRIEGGLEPLGRYVLTRDFYISTKYISSTEVSAAALLHSNNTTSDVCLTTDASSDCNSGGFYYRSAVANMLSDLEGLDRCYEPDGRTNPLYYDEIYSCPGYRLPTMAELEYALRSGTTADFWTGDGPELGGYPGYDSEGNKRIFDGVTNPLVSDYGYLSSYSSTFSKKPNGNGLYCYIACNDALTWTHDDAYSNSSYSCPDWTFEDPVCSLPWSGYKKWFGVRAYNYFNINNVRVDSFGNMVAYYNGGIGNYALVRTINP